MTGGQPWRTRVVERLGGPARARVVLVLAAVLAMDGVDKGTVSAVAGDLKNTFGLTNTQIGLLVSVVALSAAVFTIPAGMLTDRVRRTRLLAFSAVLWVVATVLSGMAGSFVWLLVARAGLGAVTATAGPTVASLSGDFFPARDRARMLGFILCGELVGTGVGFAVSSVVGDLFGWRAALWWLVLPGGLLVWAVARLPEPARAGQSMLELGQEHITDERDADDEAPAPDTGGDAEEEPSEAEQGLAGRTAERAGVEADDRLVLHSDPRNRSRRWAFRYVLRVRTNVVLILASALGYFYFTGVRSFAILFVTENYGVSSSVAGGLVLVVGAGALAGVLTGGRLADRLLRRGRITARVWVPVVGLLGVPVALAPALLTTLLLAALPLLIVGAALLGSVNPPLDAARLDIIHPYMWGTAEGVRTFLRTLGEAAAPTLFGYVSTQVFTGSNGLRYTLLVFLVALLAAAGLGLIALRTYPRDVATANASARRLAMTKAEQN